MRTLTFAIVAVVFVLLIFLRRKKETSAAEAGLPVQPYQPEHDDKICVMSFSYYREENEFENEVTGSLDTALRDIAAAGFNYKVEFLPSFQMLIVIIRCYENVNKERKPIWSWKKQ